MTLISIFTRLASGDAQRSKFCTVTEAENGYAVPTDLSEMLVLYMMGRKSTMAKHEPCNGDQPNAIAKLGVAKFLLHIYF